MSVSGRLRPTLMRSSVLLIPHAGAEQQPSDDDDEQKADDTDAPAAVIAAPIAVIATAAEQQHKDDDDDQKSHDAGPRGKRELPRPVALTQGPPFGFTAHSCSLHSWLSSARVRQPTRDPFQECCETMAALFPYCGGAIPDVAHLHGPTRSDERRVAMP